MDNISWYVGRAVSIIKAVNEPIAVTAKVSDTTSSVDQTRSVGASPATGRDVGALYEEYRDLLLFIASRKFRIGDGDAENLIQEVFLAYLQNEAQVENTRSWLVAATCNASRALSTRRTCTTLPSRTGGTGSWRRWQGSFTGTSTAPGEGFRLPPLLMRSWIRPGASGSSWR